MEIEFELEPIDRNDPAAIDPVGSITLISADATLSEQYVYIDSWLDALKEGAKAISRTERAEIDLVEEPEPLILELTERGIRISFKDNSIVVKDGAELDAAVDDAYKKLTDTQVFPKSTS